MKDGEKNRKRQICARRKGSKDEKSSSQSMKVITKTSDIVSFKVGMNKDITVSFLLFLRVLSADIHTHTDTQQKYFRCTHSPLCMYSQRSLSAGWLSKLRVLSDLHACMPVSKQASERRVESSRVGARKKGNKT